MNHQLLLRRVALCHQQRNRRQRIVVDLQLTIGFKVCWLRCKNQMNRNAPMRLLPSEKG
jgi:hypothetical protein